MRRELLAAGCFGLIACGALGQTKPGLRAESARIGQDHRVYVRWTGQPERAQPLGEEQTDVEDVRISPDRSAVAWLVGRTDLSDASYPEPFELMVAWNGGCPHSIWPGRVISVWQFEHGGARIAFWDETGHGGGSGKATLYDAHRKTPRRVG